MISLSEIRKLKNNPRFLLALGLAGILLISFPYNLGKEKEYEESSYSENYIHLTEKRLKDILSCMEGVGDVSVMVTLESSEEIMYAQNEKLSSDLTDTPSVESRNSRKESTREEYTYVFQDYGQDRSALKIKSTEPEIKGVIIACQGGGNPVVKAGITEAVSTVLGIKYSNIYVAKLK